MGEHNGKIIIYGAGARGKGCYDFIKKFNREDIVLGFCDEKSEMIKSVDGKEVLSFEEACKYDEVPFLVSIVDDKVGNSIKNKIKDANREWIDLDDLTLALGKDRVTFNREFCAFFHQDGMNEYFETAEQSEYLDVFWGEETIFYEQFKKLDLRNVIELACGRGRHVLKYIERAGEITLVDILAQNIEICKKRFQEYENIHYYSNNGYNLSELKTGQYTALFCYDAMVHFEMLDIYEYLQDIYRVLVPGGMALIHHSNNTSNYKASFANAVHGRSFMSKDIFAYLAYRCGFQIMEQKKLTWGIEDLDCISLIKKPEYVF